MLCWRCMMWQDHRSPALIPLYAWMMFVPLWIFEQTRPCKKELLFHDLDKFVSPSGWTHAGFQQFFVKPSPHACAVFLWWDLCLRCVLRQGLPSRCVFVMRLILALCFATRPTFTLSWLTWTNFVSLWPTTFWPLVILCDASIYVCAVFLRQWNTRKIVLAYLDKHILASSDSLRSLHLVSCYALATMTIPFHGLIGSGTCADMHCTPYINNQESSCNRLFHPVVI